MHVALGKVELLEALSTSELTRVGESLDAVWYRDGDAIIRQGEEGDSMYVILKGRVSVVKRCADGEEREVAQLERGQSFGETALLRREVRNASVRADGGCKVGMIGQATFLRLAPRLKMSETLSVRLARRREQS